MTDKFEPKGEGKFLHDLSSPLSTALSFTEIFLEMASESNEDDKNIDLSLIKQAYESLKKIHELLNSRREELKKGAKT